jgi:hypothetical protein
MLLSLLSTDMVDGNKNPINRRLNMAHYNRNAIKFYCGVDHKKNSYVYVIGLTGEKHLAREIPTNQKSFERVFSSFPCGEILVAVEISQKGDRRVFRAEGIETDRPLSLACRCLRSEFKPAKRELRHMGHARGYSQTGRQNPNPRRGYKRLKERRNEGKKE